MIPRIKNILYTTDLTKNSAYAFRYAVNSAQKHDAKIHILHVVEKASPSVEALVSTWVDPEKLDRLKVEKKEAQVRRIEQRLKEFAERELKDDPETLKRVASILVVEGDPATEILEKADKLGCDVVIMGSHGKGVIGHAFLGSVSEKVLHRIRRPVYIIPIPREEMDISFREI